MSRTGIVTHDSLRRVDENQHNDSKCETVENLEPASMTGETSKSLLRPPESGRSITKRAFMKTEAEKVLNEQLMKGKIPPKAKFRADDEISIGDQDGGSCQDLREQYSAPKEKKSFISSQNSNKLPSSNFSTLDVESLDRETFSQTDQQVLCALKFM